MLCTDVQRADVAVVGLLTDEFDDIRLKTSRAILRTSLTLLTSHREMTLRDVMNDQSVIAGIVSHSHAERLLRRSREPVQRALWRRISGRVKPSRSSSGQSRRRPRGRASSSSRVVTLDAGVSRVLDNDDDFVLIAESTDAAYVSSRRPGCTLTVTHQNISVAEYRFVAAATSNSSSSSSWRHLLLQRLDSSLATLQQSAVIKRLYYKWWTSTDCLAYFTDPDIWTLSVDRDATDVDETSDDERIFLHAPMSASRAEPPSRSTTREQSGSTPVNDDELDRDEISASELDVSQRPVRGLVDVITTGGLSDITASDKSHRRRHTQSLVVSSTTTTTTLTSSPNTTTTTTTMATTTELPQRSQRKLEDDTEDSRYVDGARRNYDDFDMIASIKHRADEDLFDYVLMTHGALREHVEDDVDGDVDNGDGLVSEQEMAVKEHWRRGSDTALAGEVRQSTSTTMKTASHSRVSDASDDSCVVSRPSVTLLLVVTSLTKCVSLVYSAVSRR